MKLWSWVHVQPVPQLDGRGFHRHFNGELNTMMVPVGSRFFKELITLVQVVDLDSSRWF